MELKVIFDSNVWENLVDNKIPDNIYNAIKSGFIMPLISSSSLIEQIRKKERKEVLSKYGNFSTSTSVKKNSDVLNINMSPNIKYPDVIHINMSPNIKFPPPPKEYIQNINLALNLGFKVASNLRIGMPNFDLNLHIEEQYIKNPESLEIRFQEIHYYIKNDLKAGEYEYMKLVEEIQIKENRHFNMLEALNYCDEEQSKKVPTLIAELCDGDNVAACYAYGLDYLCTNDKGKSKKGSIFADENKKKLKDKFEICILDSLELSTLISQNFVF